MLIAHEATVSETVSNWNRSQSYKLAWAVVPTLCYLLWHNRRQLATLAPSPSALGIVAAVACGAVWIVGDLLNIAQGRQLAVVAALCAVILAAVGWSAFRALVPHLCLLVFLVPFGDFLLVPLKRIAVGFASGYAAVAGLPFRSDGFSMFVGTQRYVVIDYCASLPYVMMGLFLGLTLGLLIYRSWWKIAALALFGSGLAIVANGLRIVAIISYDYLTGSELTLGQHAYFEWPALALSYGGLFVVFSRLTPEPMPNTGLPGRAAARARGAVPKSAGAVLLAVAVLASASLFWRVLPPVAMDGTAAASLPAALSDWTRLDGDPDWHPRSRIESVEVSIADYARGDQRIAVFVARATSRRDKISGGAINLVGDDVWLPAFRRPLAVCADDRCHDVQHTKILLQDSDRVRHVYRVLELAGDTMSRPLELRLRRAWATLKGARPAARLIAIASEDADGLAPADIAALIDTLSHQDPRT
jgi:exosortase